MTTTVVYLVMNKNVICLVVKYRLIKNFLIKKIKLTLENNSVNEKNSIRYLLFLFVGYNIIYELIPIPVKRPSMCKHSYGPFIPRVKSLGNSA